MNGREKCNMAFGYNAATLGAAMLAGVALTLAVRLLQLSMRRAVNIDYYDDEDEYEEYSD